MNSNNQSDDEDMFFVSKIQAQKVEIEALEKQIRVSEFQYKQQISELTNDLERERKRTEELQARILRSIEEIGNGDLSNFAQEMESKLAIAENTIQEYRTNELKLNKEIQNLRKKGDSEEIDELKMQLIKMEESAIVIIIEKEKMISDLKDQIEEFKYQTNMPIEHNMEEKDGQVQHLKDLIQELNFKIEQDQLQFDERLMRMEHEITERILDGLHHQIDESKNVEQDLLQQIMLSEEKIKHLDKILQDQDKLIISLKDEHKRETANYELRVNEMSKRLSASIQQVLKSDKKSEEAFKQLAFYQREKNNHSNQRDEQLRKIIILENQIRKYTEEISELNSHISDQQQNIEELELNQKYAENRCQELQSYYEQQIILLKHSQDQITESEEQGQGGNLLSELLQLPEMADSNTFNIQQTPEPKMALPTPKRSGSKRKKFGPDDIDFLKEEITIARNRILDLEQDLENSESNILVLQSEMKAILLEIQNLRKSKIDSTQQRELLQELEQLKQYLHKLETHSLAQKQMSAEESCFLKEELKRAEKDCINAKILYSQAMSEKEYFQAKLRKLEKQIKKQEVKDIKKAPLSPVQEVVEPTSTKSSWYSNVFKKS